MELTIDTASSLAGLALTREGQLIAESSWSTDRGHASELLPSIERLLAGVGVERGALSAIFVNRGPGGYAGLRVGISTAMALAFALGTDLLTYGRLEADAYPYLALGRPVCAVHDAGRGEFAWAVYKRTDESFTELQAPRIGPPESLVESIGEDYLLAGEVSARLRDRLPDGQTVIAGPAVIRRAGTGAALAWHRYASGARDSHHALTPLYLREPNITTPRQRNAGAPS
ncbi:MAG: tRNA (adenosine(37)-N6)-threonylcarbamoyltransferase complex dimerization subunit type 1 TsaB [Dehalococcoidia bacterium]